MPPICVDMKTNNTCSTKCIHNFAVFLALLCYTDLVYLFFLGVARLFAVCLSLVATRIIRAVCVHVYEACKADRVAYFNMKRMTLCVWVSSLFRVS